MVRAARRWLYALVVLVVVGAGPVAPARAAPGDPDATFGTGGVVTTDFLVEWLPNVFVSAFDGATAVALQADGKIVAAGFTSDAGFNFVLGLVRYNPDGTLDAGFGSGGKVPASFFRLEFLPEERNLVDVAIQTDGRIVVVGTFQQTPGSPREFGIARFDPDGTLDGTFGGGAGWVTTAVGGSDSGATSVAIQPDGRIVVGGWVTGGAGYSDFALVRYNSDGTLDTAGFGAGTGMVTADFSGFNDFANGVALQSDGKIVAAGGAAPDGTFRRDFAVARFNADGTLDTAGFGGATGKVTTDMTGTSDWDLARAVAIQSDGKIVVAGGAVIYNAVCGCTHFAIARYDAGGVLDPGFGTGGKVLDDFVGGGDLANDVAIQADGRIVAAGLVQQPADIEQLVDFGVARYNVDGTPDATFGNAGKVVTDFQAYDVGSGVVLQPDCGIVVAGYTIDWASFDSNFALARYDGGCAAPVAKCPLSQGYWKNHAASWPVVSLSLGDESYSQAELLALLSTASKTNASRILARQLVAAKLNIADGSDPGPANAAVADADALLAAFNGKLPYNVPASSTIGQAMIADATVLEQYNLATLTPGCVP